MKWIICLSLVFLAGCADTIADQRKVEHANGTDRLVLRSVEESIPEGTAYNFHSIVWQQWDGETWSTVAEIDARAFQGDSPNSRWVSDIESLDPESGYAVIKVAENDAPDGSISISVVYSWREWDLVNNEEVRVIRVLEDPFEPFRD